MKKKVTEKIVKKAVRRKIIKPSTLEWNPDWNMDDVGMTQSLWDTYMGCKRAFLFKINGYGQPLYESKTHFGSVVHHVLDRSYTYGKIPLMKQIGKYIDEYTEIVLKRGTVLTHEELETTAAKAHATMVGYFEYYHDEFIDKKFIGVEHVFNQRFGICMQRGRLDGSYMKKSNGLKFTVDHKTKGQISEDNIALHLNIDFQTLFYMLNDELETNVLADGSLYNIIRNSQSKPHKNEKTKAYFSRILELCRKTPEHFYKRWEVVYTKEQHKQFRNELHQLQHDLKYVLGGNTVCNRFNCHKQFACEFLPACASDSMKDLSKSTLPIKEFLFPELKED